MTRTVSIGDNEIDLDKIAPKNIEAMTLRGIRHFLGNEVSARVGASFKREAVEAYKQTNGGEIDADSRKAVESNAIPATDSAAYVSMKSKIFSEFLNTLYTGEVGLNERGPTVDPLTAEIRAIVKRDVLAVLRNTPSADGETKLWSGKKDPTDETVIGPFASGATRTFGELKDKYLEKHEGKVNAEAKKRLDAVAKAKDAASKLGADADVFA
jgi:hypothetical protein